MGLAEPRSIIEIIERLTPLRVASASSVKARAARNSRTRWAMRSLMPVSAEVSSAAADGLGSSIVDALSTKLELTVNMLEKGRDGGIYAPGAAWAVSVSALWAVASPCADSTQRTNSAAGMAFA
ncbi:hypothetical protein PSP6_320095 [Paraburkholderia tropica]|nr:hypothetical protein PSP6_320095 [Paraburkholderia tropica]